MFFCDRLALAGDVAAVAVDLDLGERQRPLLAGQLDPDVAARTVPCRSAAGRQRLRQPVQQRLDLRDRGSARWPGSRISGIASTQVVQRPATDFVAERPGLVDAAVGGDQGDEAELRG